MGLFSIAPWQRKQKTEPEAKGAEKFPSPSDDQRADDYFAGMTPYEREREEARFRVITDSMERALGRGKLRRNPPCQQNDYNQFRW